MSPGARLLLSGKTSYKTTSGVKNVRTGIKNSTSQGRNTSADNINTIVFLRILTCPSIRLHWFSGYKFVGEAA